MSGARFVQRCWLLLLWLLLFLLMLFLVLLSCSRCLTCIPVLGTTFTGTIRGHAIQLCTNRLFRIKSQIKFMGPKNQQKNPIAYTEYGRVERSFPIEPG